MTLVRSIPGRSLTGATGSGTYHTPPGALGGTVNLTTSCVFNIPCAYSLILQFSFFLKISTVARLSVNFQNQCCSVKLRNT